MNQISTLLPAHPAPAALPRRALRNARFVRYGASDEPPVVEEIADDEATLVDALFVRVAEYSSVPAIAAREVIENLVHADFAGACVSVLDDGATVRVSDFGRGIADKERALEPGYSTADARLRTIVRGVGSGLAVATAAMASAGGSLELDDNLGAGTVATLRAPAQQRTLAATELTETARRLLAVLVELGPVEPTVLAEELDAPLPVCTRELVVLEHRGLVIHHACGTRELTGAGTELLTSLF